MKENRTNENSKQKRKKTRNKNTMHINLSTYIHVFISTTYTHMYTIQNVLNAVYILIDGNRTIYFMKCFSRNFARAFLTI